MLRACLRNAARVGAQQHRVVSRRPGAGLAPSHEIARSVWHAGLDAEAAASKVAAEIERIDKNLWQARFDDTPPEHLKVAEENLEKLKKQYEAITGEPYDS